MDEQGNFANECLPGTVRAGGKPDILIWIQDELIFRGQIPKFWKGCLLFSHDYLAYSGYSLSPKDSSDKRKTYHKHETFEYRQTAGKFAD